MGSVRPWGYPGRGLLTTPSRGYPQIQPPPKIPASARSHLAHQITSNPGLWLGFAHHLLIWGGLQHFQAAFLRLPPPFLGVAGRTQPGPPGRPLSRRGRGAALPPGGTAPAAARSCLASSLYFHYSYYYFYPMAQPSPRGSCSQCALGAAGGGRGCWSRRGSEPADAEPPASNTKTRVTRRLYQDLT